MSFDDEHAVIVETFVHRALILEVVEPLKSGKEATVYRCRAHPSSGAEQLALKIYRSREDRSFKNDALYQEGDWRWRVAGGATRAARAFRAKTRFGREVQAAAWVGREWEHLEALHAGGVAVPRPVAETRGAVLMELFAADDGTAAPPLHAVALEPEEARRLRQRLFAEVARMLALDLVHGDLSPYNVLYARGEYRIIDFPQAVDPRFNPSAFRLLARDLENLHRYCARFGAEGDPAGEAAEMWTRWMEAQM